MVRRGGQAQGGSGAVCAFRSGRELRGNAANDQEAGHATVRAERDAVRDSFLGMTLVRAQPSRRRPVRAHLTDDGVSLRSGGQLANEKAAVSTDRPRRFPAPAETVDAPPDSERHWGDRRGYILRRLLAGADLLALVCAGAITHGTVTLVGRTSKPADVLLFLLLLPLWTYIASLLRLYHLAERSFDSSWVDEIAPIVLAATAWSWILLLARAAFESGPVAGSAIDSRLVDDDRDHHGLSFCGEIVRQTVLLVPPRGRDRRRTPRREPCCPPYRTSP